MILEHRGKRPNIHQTSYIAPTAVICGDVTIEENTFVSFGAILVAEGMPIHIGKDCIIRENVLIRSTTQHKVWIGNSVLIGPHSSLSGCRVEDQVFIAAGVTIFHASQIGSGAEIRINGVVHVKTRLPPEALVPIGWIAVGDPAIILPPNEHDKIWQVQKTLDFPATVYGMVREADGSVDMTKLTRRLIQNQLSHRDDKVL